MQPYNRNRPERVGKTAHGENSHAERWESRRRGGEGGGSKHQCPLTSPSAACVRLASNSSQNGSGGAGRGVLLLPPAEERAADALAERCSVALAVEAPDADAALGEAARGVDDKRPLAEPGEAERCARADDGCSLRAERRDGVAMDERAAATREAPRLTSPSLARSAARPAIGSAAW